MKVIKGFGLLLVGVLLLYATNSCLSELIGLMHMARFGSDGSAISYALGRFLGSAMIEVVLLVGFLRLIRRRQA